MTENGQSKKILSNDFKEIISQIIIEKMSIEYDINLVTDVFNNIELQISDKFELPKNIERLEAKNFNQRTNGQLEIVLNPTDQNEFKRKLLVTKSATIRYFYDNGNVIDKHWDASKFKSDSDLMGNINSKSGIRKKERIEQGVIKVEIKINE